LLIRATVQNEVRLSRSSMQHRNSPHRIGVVLVALLGCSASAWGQSTSIGDYTLLAERMIRTRRLTLTKGDMGVASPTGGIFSRGILDAPTSVLAADTVRMQRNTDCGALFANATEGTGAGCGNPQPFVSPFSDLAAACGFPAPFPVCDPSAPPIVVAANQTLALAPGTYGDVYLQGGPSGSGTLELAGTYRFCNVVASLDATTVFTAPSTVNVTGNLLLSRATTTNPTVGAEDIRFFVQGSIVRVSRNALVTAVLCAPDATLAINTGTTLEGRFIAENIRLKRNVVMGTPSSTTTTSSTSTSSTSSTSTSMAPETTTSTSLTPASTTSTSLTPASTTSTSVAPETTTSTSLTPDSTTSTTLAPPTTTSLPPDSTTSTTLAPPTTTSTSLTPVSTTSTSLTPETTTSSTLAPETTTTTLVPDTTTSTLTPETTTTTSTSTSSTLTPATTTSTTLTPTTTTTTLPDLVEICGNCIDDDFNNLTDFEDPACCSGSAGQSFVANLRRGRIKPKPAERSFLRLRSTLASSGLELNPMEQEVFLHIREQNGPEVLCAMVPAGKFMKMRKSYKFWDKKGMLSSAQGVQDMALKFKRNGQVRFKAYGKRVRFPTPDQNSLLITVGFRNPTATTDANRCAGALEAFRTNSRGALIFR